MSKKSDPATPRVGMTVNFGAHGARPGKDVLLLPAMVCAVHETDDNGLPLLDLYIWNSWTEQNGYARRVKGYDKARVGGWTTSYEIDEAAIEKAEKPEARPINSQLPAAPAPEQPKELDPQLDGMPNVFGGLTRYNPAVDRQQHSNAQGQLLWVCPTCDKWHWVTKGDPIPADGSCCADAMRRRAPGKQASTAWDKWKIPGDDVLVGTKVEGEAEDDRPVIGD